MIELVKLMADEGVRGELNDDNPALSLFSTIDCIQHSANKKDKTQKAAKAKWDRLVAEDSEFKDELLSQTVMMKVHNISNGILIETPAMTVIGLKILLFILGGKVAMEFRRTVDSFFTRFIAGDESLVKEIRANAANNSIMHKTFREALQLEPMQNASASNDGQEVVKRPLDRLLGKRPLETDDDVQLVDKALTIHERAFEVHQKIEYGKIELHTKKELAELDVKKAKDMAELDVKKAKDMAELALKERKKYADQWGQLGLREKQIELQERQFKLNVEMRDKNIQMSQKATATKTQKPFPPPSKEKAPAASAPNMPPPPSKEKAPAASTPELSRPSSTEKAPRTASDIHNKWNTKKQNKNGATYKQARTVIHLPGQTRISFPTTSRISRT
jgi:hypothetical protein